VSSWVVDYSIPRGVSSRKFSGWLADRWTLAQSPRNIPLNRKKLVGVDGIEPPTAGV
jgi:hypothetical protein